MAYRGCSQGLMGEGVVKVIYRDQGIIRGIIRVSYGGIVRISYGGIVRVSYGGIVRVSYEV